MVDGDSVRHQLAYDQFAERFAVINAAMPASYVALAGDFEKHAGRGPILDLGCGAGRDMAFWADRGRQVIGLDLSIGMLRQAAIRSGRPLTQADMRRLPFRAARFGGVWCSASLLHLPKSLAPAVLAEVARVLEPGAPLLVTLKEGSGEAWEEHPPGHTSATRFFARYSPAEVDALLATANFTTRIRRQNTAQTGVTWLTHLATSRLHP